MFRVQFRNSLEFDQNTFFDQSICIEIAHDYPNRKEPG